MVILKNVSKRTLSLLLAFVMVFSLMTWGAVEVEAAGTEIPDFSVDGLSATYEVKANKGEVSAIATNEISIVATATYAGCQGTASTVVVTLKNTLQTEAVLHFTPTEGGTGSGSITYKDNNGNTFSSGDTLAFQGSVIITVTADSSDSEKTKTLKLSDISLSSPDATYDVTVQYDSNLGSVKVDGTTVSSGHKAESVESVTLEATTNSGSTFHGWVNEASGAVLSTALSFTYQPGADTTIKAAFMSASGKAWWSADGKLYDDLTAACTVAQAGDKKVVLAADGTLPAGEYTIPAGVTLLIPFDSANTLYTAEPKATGTYTTPTAYRTLRMESGAHIVVNGAISVSGQHMRTAAGQMNGNAPSGPQGFIAMADGSKITLNNGAKLYAWGYITGAGQVIANSGAEVHELIQIADFRGGSQTIDMQNSVFPFCQYYVQNIEAELWLYSGAKEYSYTTIYMSSREFPSSVAFIGSSGCMFNLTDGYVVKKYDGATDSLILDAYGTISIDPITMSVGIGNNGFTGISINSSEYVLPITNNFKVSVYSGSITLNQDLALLPGAEINVESGAICTVGSGVSVYVYDADIYSKAYNNTLYPNLIGKYCWGNVGSTQQNVTFVPLIYAPGRTHNRAEADLVDAKITVAGTVDASAGYIYTTEGGASVTGVDGAVVKINLGTATITYQVLENVSGEDDFYIQVPITAPILINGNETYLETAKGGNNTYIYTNGKWICATDDGGNHIPGAAAACTTAQTCTVCGEELAAATDHDYSESYDWDRDDYVSCTATRKCSKCTVFETETTNKIEKKNNATCTEDGKITYTATFDAEWADKQTMIDNSSALGHTFGETTSAKAATCTETGNDAYKYCSVCELYFAADAESNSTAGEASADAFKINIVANAHAYPETPSGYEKATDTHVAYYVCEHNSEHIKKDAAASHTYVNGLCVCTAVQTFTVTWIVEDKTHKTETVEYGKDASVIEVPIKTGHTGVWDKAATNVTSDVTITAVYTANNYSYTIETYTMGIDGSYGQPTTETKEATFGNKVTITPTVETGFTLDSEVSVLEIEMNTENNVLKVYIKRNQYKLYTSVDNGTAVEVATYYYGQSVTAPASPTKEGHTFSGWTGVPTTMPANDVTVSGTFEINTYSVIFKINGEEYETKHFNYGAAVTAPEYTTPTGYTFSGWTLPERMPAEDITIDATLTINSYTVTWIVDGKTTTETYDYGKTPSFKGETAKVKEVCTVYTFKGWDNDFVAVTGDVTYTAQYESGIEHTYGNIVEVNDATCISTGNSAYKQCETCKKYFAEDAANNSTDGKDTNADFVISQKEHSYTGEIKSDGNGKYATHSYLCVNGCDEYGGAVKHTWNNGEVTTEPKCEAEGVRTYTCTVEGCGATYTEEVSALGHNWKDATCTAPKTCSACGETDGEALGHTFTDGNDTECDRNCGFSRAAYIGDTSFATLDEALEAANEGETIVLLKQIVIGNGEAVTIDKNVTIETSVIDVFTVTAGGTLTLGENLKINSNTSILWANGGTINVDGANLSSVDSPYTIAFANNDGVININSGTISASGTNNVTVTASGGTVNISGGEVLSADSSAVVAKNNGIVNISGGTVKTTCTSYDYCAAFARYGGVINVTGGEINSAAGIGLDAVTGGTVKVSDGTVNGVVAHESATAKAVISGGDITGSVYANDGASLTVSGGTFDNDVTKYCVDGHHTVVSAESGKYVYGEHDYESEVTAPTCTEAGYTTYTCACGDTYTANKVEALGHTFTDGNDTECDRNCGFSRAAYIGDTSFATLGEALEAAKEDETIVLLKQIVIGNGETVTIDKNVTIKTSVTDVFTVTAGTLNLKNVTINSNTSILWANGGTINVDGANLSSVDSPYTIAFADNGGEINIKSGKISASGSNNVTVAASGGTVNISGGEVLSANSSAVMAKNDGIVNISGGTVKTTCTSYDYCAAFARYGGVINVTGGEINSAAGIGLDAVTGGTVTVSGGTVNGVVAHESANATAEISGGNITGSVYADNGASLTVSGGTFVNDVTEYCDKDHHTVDTDKNGSYVYGEHAHGSYGYNETDHWSVCSCGEKLEKTKTAHNFMDGKDSCECGLSVIKVETAVESIEYTVNGRVVTVSHEVACKVGYLDDDGAYVALKATNNGDGSYSFTAPVGVDKVLIVVKGDANGDGRVTASDIARINSGLNNKIYLKAEEIFAGDVNGDGEANEDDFEDIKADVLKTATLQW